MAVASRWFGPVAWLGCALLHLGVAAVPAAAQTSLGAPDPSNPYRASTEQRPADLVLLREWSTMEGGFAIGAFAQCYQRAGTVNLAIGTFRIVQAFGCKRLCQCIHGHVWLARSNRGVTRLRPKTRGTWITFFLRHGCRLGQYRHSKIKFEIRCERKPMARPRQIAALFLRP